VDRMWPAEAFTKIFNLKFLEKRVRLKSHWTTCAG